MSEHITKHEISISTSTFIRICVFGLLLLAASKLTDLILVVLTSIVIASFIEFSVDKLKPYIKNRTLVVFLIYSISIAFLVYLFSVFVPVFVSEMSALVTQLGQYIPDNSILNTFQTDTISGAHNVVNNISKNASLSDIIKSTQGLIGTFSGGFFDVAGFAFGSAFNLALIMVISFYLSVKEKGIENFLRIVIPDSHEEYAISLWSRTERKIGLWLQGQMLLGLIIGMLAYLSLTILGVNYSLVLAILTALLELIPLGIYIAMIPAVMFGFLSGGVSMAAMSFIIYFILHQFETYLIAPLIIKKVVGISPLVVILSVLIGFTLAGFWGVILAIPCAVCILEFLDDLEKKKILSRTN
ncbi:MAG: AI-2E family transporter [Candidatus Nomurabacteria bacterium]|nr:AI-2E family transporter [Candidatus Nomurabacteria bacterium]